MRINVKVIVLALEGGYKQRILNSVSSLAFSSSLFYLMVWEFQTCVPKRGMVSGQWSHWELQSKWIESVERPGGHCWIIRLWLLLSLFSVYSPVEALQRVFAFFFIGVLPQCVICKVKQLFIPRVTSCSWQDLRVVGVEKDLRAGDSVRCSYQLSIHRPLWL